jgi:ornithine cyclodeaminase
MLLLSREDILRVFTMRDAIEADKTAFRIHSEGKDKVSLRTNLEGPGGKGQYLFMPAYAGEIDRAGIKIVSVFPGNAAKGKPLVPATVVLLDNETGEVCALLDGTTLTQIRTAAIAGAATDLLARPNSRVAALFGTGGQAPAQMEALLVARPIREVRVYDSDPARAEAFVSARRELAERYGAALRRAVSPREALEGADVITTVTTSTRPVFEGAWVEEGAHVTGVGSYTPTMQELPPELLERAARIYVDDREAVESEAGDFLIPQAEGRFSRDRITGELGELILGRTPGRTDAREITVMKTVGFATLDVVTADEILRRALAAGVGRTVAL